MTARYALAAAALLVVATHAAPAGADPIDASCTQTGQPLAGMTGDSFEVTCPAGCAEGRVWGTEVYSDDSSICRAAVHAGVLDVDAGGVVIVTLHEGQASYPASLANGVQSELWGPWQRSFVVAAPSAEAEPEP